MSPRSPDGCYSERELLGKNGEGGDLKTWLGITDDLVLNVFFLNGQGGLTTNRIHPNPAIRKLESILSKSLSVLGIVEGLWSTNQSIIHSGMEEGKEEGGDRTEDSWKQREMDSDSTTL